ncbi:hypothetical protein BJ138DRAFT_1154558 [Hygrophoropsis aurantiaca]|uniref:Uncharacterized protein n=1 Tax=Hygrophoropsis aurantiaca TaxID=72124 RepID=A0ACB8A9H1_9AGAM|nr:hypothetical protein BJ138DRAFT_1154558 [Hygrophoropsis aurantiaca]
MPMSSNADACDASPLDWALLILMLLSTHVTWWAVHLPTLYRTGFGAYLHSVAWECTRIHLPSFAGFLAVAGHPPEHWHSNYYSGISTTTRTRGLGTALLKDGLVLVTSILAVVRLCTALRSPTSGNLDLSGLNGSLWNYPSLPTALIGASISVAGASGRVSAARTAWVTMGVLTCAGAAIVTGVALSDTGPEKTNIWIGILITYLVMALPIALVAPRTILPVLCVTLAALARVGGPAAGALVAGAYFPYCQLKGKAFGGVLVALGVLAGLLALYGFIRCRPREPVSQPEDMIDEEDLESRRVGYGRMDGKWKGDTELRPVTCDTY